MRFSKKAVIASLASSVRSTRTAEDMVALEALHQVRVLRTDDAKEAINAFFEKRTPKFSGR